MSAVIHHARDVHKCRIGWKAVPLPEDALARSTGAVAYLVPDGLYDPPGTVRECDVCGKTWVGYRPSPRLGGGYISVITQWRPEGRFERWRRERREARNNLPTPPERQPA